MLSKLNHPTLFKCVAIALVFVGCVNPPQRASGVNPSPAKSPGQGGPLDSGRDLPGPGVPSGDDQNRGPELQTPPITVPDSSGSSGTKVSYWLNKTDNNNCLTIQVVGAAAAVTAPCSTSESGSPKWVESTFAATESLKATLKVDTTDKAQAKFSSSSDSLGDMAWRWRCVSKVDAASKKNVHVACYEDGNALKKTFESSDLFVQIIGPSTVDLGGIQCTKVTDFDLTTCSGK